MNIYNTWTTLIVYYQHHHHHQHFCVPHIIMQLECNQLKYSVNAFRYEWESDVRGHSFTCCVNYSYRPPPTRTRMEVAWCHHPRTNNKSTATGDVIIFRKLIQIKLNASNTPITYLFVIKTTASSTTHQHQPIISDPQWRGGRDAVGFQWSRFVLMIGILSGLIIWFRGGTYFKLSRNQRLIHFRSNNTKTPPVIDQRD